MSRSPKVMHKDPENPTTDGKQQVDKTGNEDQIISVHNRTPTDTNMGISDNANHGTRNTENEPVALMGNTCSDVKYYEGKYLHQISPSKYT